MESIIQYMADQWNHVDALLVVTFGADAVPRSSTAYVTHFDIVIAKYDLSAYENGSRLTKIDVRKVSGGWYSASYKKEYPNLLSQPTSSVLTDDYPFGQAKVKMVTDGTTTTSVKLTGQL